MNGKRYLTGFVVGFVDEDVAGDNRFILEDTTTTSWVRPIPKVFTNEEIAQRQALILKQKGYKAFYKPWILETTATYSTWPEVEPDFDKSDIFV
jgi:hypothetical protein